MSDITTSTMIMNPGIFGQHCEVTTVVQKNPENMHFFKPLKKIVQKGKNFVRTVGKNGDKWPDEVRSEAQSKEDSRGGDH
ncbi:hypothetical protein LINPERPRIM_LOCUS26834 [Linum perenne]